MNTKTVIHLNTLAALLCCCLPFTAIAVDANRFDVTSATDMGAAGCSPATPSDGLSDSGPFQCILNYLGAQSPSCERIVGGVVHVPIGIFDFDQPLVIACGSQMIGDGVSGKFDNVSIKNTGSMLRRMPGTVWKSNALLTMRDDTIIRDLVFDEEQPGSPPFNDNWFIIQCQGNEVLVENVLLFKAFRGIAIGGQGAGTGRTTLRNIRGEPILTGILIDNVTDVVRVHDVHFWPFWSIDRHGDVDTFRKTYGTGIVTKRSDNPFFTNLFFLGYSVGVKFETSSWPDQQVSGSTSKAKFVNVDCDLCGVGILMDSTDALDNIVQSFSYQAMQEVLGWRVPLLVLRERNKISVSDASIDLAPGAAVRVTGSDHFVRVGQWYVRRWNVSGSGAAAFESTSANSRVWVRESYGRWPNGGGTCTGTTNCDFALGQNL